MKREYRSPISGYVNGEHPWTGRVMVIIWGGTLLITLMAVIALVVSGRAGADPYCGENSYYDYRHQICEAFATPPPYLVSPPVYANPWDYDQQP